ncbi:MAG: TonB-dependent receptor [Tannerella sp.]|nr:TonB-dependent receptor [Tannerella sp.]
MNKLKSCFKILLFTASLFTCNCVFAQSITVSGTVGDGVEPLPGASVIIKGTTIGTVTDSEGNFSLKVPDESSVLTFSYMGYTEQSITVGTLRAFNIVLDSDQKLLDEVVVIGYGTTRRRDLTGATVSVRGSELASIPVTTAAQAITGKLAGVNVVTQNGAPGADVNITVRGGTSITQSTAPLYIVDGFQMEDGLKYVDINDIESIDVMKDASATAIYGARGSNGVILITTKSGKAGKTQVSYNTYLSFERLGKSLNMMNPEEYVNYQYEFLMLRQNMTPFVKYFGGGNLNDSGFYTGAAQYISNTYGNQPGFDWQDIVFGGNALLQNHNVTITGGSDKTKFVLSYNLTDQDGIIDKYGYMKNNIRAKIDHEIRDWLRIDINTNFNSIKQDGGTSLGGRMRGTMLMPVTGGIYFTDEEIINTTAFYDTVLSDFGSYNVFNPLVLNDAITQQTLTRQYSVNAGLSIDLLKNLTWRTAGSYFWQQVRSDSWDDGRTTDAIATHGGLPYGSRNNSERFSWQITNTLAWSQYFGKHGLNAMLGQEVYELESMKLDNTYDQFSNTNFHLDNLTGAESFSREAGKSTNRTISAFGRVMYNYADRYLVTATVRGDGVSKFARENQWGILPSASAAWRISEEKFMKDMSFINQLKLRVGYGVTGNSNIDNNMYATTYGSSKYVINNTVVAGLAPGSKLGNSNLKWEKTTSTNVGLDISIIKSRINLSVDWYNQQSDNLLLEVDIPRHTGYQTQFQNVGSIRNRGWEFVLNTRNIDNGQFGWTTDFNISFNRSKVLSLYGNDTKRMPPGTFLIEEGSPLGQFYGYKYQGVYTTDDFTQNADGSYTLKNGIARPKAPGGTIKPGDLKYEATNDEFDSDGNPVWTTDDRTVIGNAMPKFTGGMVNTFMYKGFDLSVFMNFSYGNKVLNLNKQQFMGPYLGMVNAFSEMSDRYILIDPATGRETTDLTRLAALNPDQHASDKVWSLQQRNQAAYTDNNTYYLEDGSFLRINTVTLGYTLPSALIKKIGLGSVRAYMTLNNPYIFTNYSGYDPEVSNSSKGFEQGIDNAAYPRAKSFVAGLNLTF